MSRSARQLFEGRLAALTSHLAAAPSPPQPSKSTMSNRDWLLPVQELPAQIRQLDWVQDMLANGYVATITTSIAVSRASGLPSDNLLTSYLETGLLKGIGCFYNLEAKTLRIVYALGDKICGFPSMVHGGFATTLLDDSLGGYTYLMKHENGIPVWPSYTVRLELDLKTLVKASSVVCCTTQLLETSSRKIWLSAKLEDRPGGNEHVSAKALLLAPK